jgi:hypothetical protein
MKFMNEMARAIVLTSCEETKISSVDRCTYDLNLELIQPLVQE